MAFFLNDWRCLIKKERKRKRVHYLSVEMATNGWLTLVCCFGKVAWRRWYQNFLFAVALHAAETWIMWVRVAMGSLFKYIISIIGWTPSWSGSLPNITLFLVRTNLTLPSFVWYDKKLVTSLEGLFLFSYILSFLIHSLYFGAWVF